MPKIVSSGKALHSPEFHEEKRKRRRLRRYIVAGILLVLLVAPVIVLRLESLSITSVEILGTNVLEASDVSEVVQDKLKGSYLWVVPHSSSLVYPRRSLRESLLLGMPRIKLASTRLSNINTLEVTIEERRPYALYCAELALDGLAENCYFLDKSGFIFAEAPAFSGAVYFIFTQDKPLKEPLAKFFLPEEEFAKLVDFIESLPALGFEPASFYIETSDTAVVMRYNVVLLSGTKLFWNSDQDLSLVRSNLEAMLAGSAEETEGLVNNLLYIDLRSPNKVFYKFKDTKYANSLDE